MAHIVVILGSTRPNRRSEVVGQWLMPQLKTLGVDAELVDLRDYPLPFYNEPASVKALQGVYSADVAQVVKAWSAKVAEADGFIIITPEYNHGYSGVLKNALDYLYDEWNDKPIGFISYGGLAGGSRAVEQLRLVSIELQMAPIREAIHIPFIREAFASDGQLTNPLIAAKVPPLVEQLTRWAKALKSARVEKRSVQ